MKTILLILAFTPTLSWATLPEYVGNAQGVALRGVLQREHFRLAAGRLGNCQTTSREGTSTWRGCELIGASITLSDDAGHSQTMPLATVLISDYRVNHDQQAARDYLYRGAWRDQRDGMAFDDKISVELTQDETNPSRLRGNLQFDTYNLSYGIEARVE